MSTGSRRSLVAEPMHALFLNRDEPFRISHPTPRGDDCTVLEFSLDAVTEVVGSLDSTVLERPDAPFGVTHVPFGEAARLALHRLRTAEPRAGDSLSHEERCLGLLGEVLAEGYRAHGRTASPRREATRRSRRDLVEPTREALAIAPTAPWSLRALAREVDSSPYHLTRVFRAMTGLPIHRHLVRLRLAVALEDLHSGGRSLSEVALRAGFASHSHFATAFRSSYGMAPGALRGRLTRSGGSLPDRPGPPARRECRRRPAPPR